MEKKQKGAMGEVIRFAVSGGVCFLIEWGVLWLLKERLGLDTLIATPLAFLLSVIVNYLLCMHWVFEGTKDGGDAAKLGFLVTSLMGLGLNELLMLILRAVLGEERLLMTVAGFDIRMYMLNKAIATLLVMIWNYFTKKAVLQSAVLRRLAQRLKSRKKG